MNVPHRSLLLPALTGLALLATLTAQANNIAVSNVTLTGQNTTNHTYQVQFNLSWENSWRTSTLESNYDAAWIFIKWRQAPAGVWQHALLSTTGQVQPTGGTITVPADAHGAFLYRTANGTGNVNYTGIQLRWSYGTSMADTDPVEVIVLAIEMVYVPAGAFYAGDGSGNYTFCAGNTSAAKLISSEAALTLGGNAAANLSCSDPVGDDFNSTTQQSLAIEFPKGFSASFVTKYEITQGQYAEFLNRLNSTQATARFNTNPNSISEYNIANTGPVDAPYIAATPDRGCASLSVLDLLAYADWSGLRPMTELEFEKACRGTRPPVIGEFAWGTPYKCTSSTYGGTLNPGLPNEKYSTICSAPYGNGDFYYNNIGHPLRAGAFAASVTSPSREQAGASYWGIMELSGSVGELCVSVSTFGARLFQANLGDGVLNPDGTANTLWWPVTNESYRVRGGQFSYTSEPSWLGHVSSRANDYIISCGGHLCR